MAGGTDPTDAGSRDLKLGTAGVGLMVAIAILLAIFSGDDGDESEAASGTALSTEVDAAADDVASPEELEAEANDIRARLEAAGFTVSDVAVGGTQASLRIPVEGDGRITAHVLGTDAGTEAFTAKLEKLKSNPTFKGGALVEPVGTNVYVGKFPVESAANEATFNEVVAAGGGTN